MPQNAVWRGGPSLRVVGGRFLEELLQIILPVAILILALIEHLKAKGLILEVLAELLPRDLSTDLSEVRGYRALVVGVLVPLRCLPLLSTTITEAIGFLPRPCWTTKSG